MQHFLSRIKDSRLDKIIDSIPFGNKEEFENVCKQYQEYDPSFLWLLTYPGEGQEKNSEYLEKGYRKFHKILDSGFPKLLARNGYFESRMWELILCDTLSFSGDLQPKSAEGADIILKSPSGKIVQVEAVAPNEAFDVEMKAIRPDYSSGNIFEFVGQIHDIERPVVLRALKAFSSKEGGYDYKSPLILAINAHKTVGTISSDSYILRRILFGLGNQTLTKTINGNYISGFEQLPNYNKPNKEPFPVAYFRGSEYSHISGVIYTSQSPMGLIPGGYGWHNTGITFVPNPMAAYPVELDLPFFKKIHCNEYAYQEFEPVQNFKTSESLNILND